MSMTRYRNTVVGSYPRPTQAADTMKKPTLTQADTDEMVRWAAKDQSDLGLDVITDGEAYRENMYYFYQKRVDGVTFEDMPRLTFGDAGFGIECPRVIGELENPRFQLAHNWKLARDAAPAGVRVKQTVTGPHVLTRFSVNERKDLYPDDQALCRAWADVLKQELDEVIAAGCTDIQFDEPMWTEAPQQSEWAADILNELIEALPDTSPRRIACLWRKSAAQAGLLHQIHRSRARVPQDEDRRGAARALHFELRSDGPWTFWDFKGDLGLGVIDQRSDESRRSTWCASASSRR